MLAIRRHGYHNTKIFDLSGRFDSNSKIGLEVAILGAKEMGCHHIVLNFTDLTWIDSKGLGQLFLWCHNMKFNHVRLSIVSPQSTVKHLLESTHLTDLIPIYQTEQEAVEAHNASTVQSEKTPIPKGPSSRSIENTRFSPLENTIPKIQ